jgi:predicted RNase H-like nuclease (RuvC/YqgF family)
MRKLLISAAIVTAVAATAPASAQYRDYDRDDRRYGQSYQHGRDIPQQLGQLSERIERSRERRLISRDEARRLRVQLDRIDERFRAYRRDGISRWEHQDLQQRIQQLRQRIRWERQEERYDRRY